MTVAAYDRAVDRDSSTPSQTAMMAALGRATHLLHYGPNALFDDWLAWPLVGPAADPIIDGIRPLLGDDEVPIATWFAARSRLTEDWLAATGAAQYVILGAGLDSYAWRTANDVRVFEVDHPATQAGKQARATRLGLSPAAAPTWVPVDFERADLATSLAEAGLDPTTSAFVSWLGVVPYLTPEAIRSTLNSLPPCTLAVGYVVPESFRDEDARRFGAVIETQVATMGEPWLSLMTPTEFATLLATAGFSVVEDVGAHDIESRYGIPAVNYERMALARKG